MVREIEIKGTHRRSGDVPMFVPIPRTTWTSKQLNVRTRLDLYGCLSGCGSAPAPRQRGLNPDLLVTRAAICEPVEKHSGRSAAHLLRRKRNAREGWRRELTGHLAQHGDDGEVVGDAQPALLDRSEKSDHRDFLRHHDGGDFRMFVQHAPSRDRHLLDRQTAQARQLLEPVPLAGLLVTAQSPRGEAVLPFPDERIEYEQGDRTVTQAHEMVDRHLDGMLDVDVDEAQPGVIEPVPDHDEWVAMIPQKFRPAIVRQDLAEDDPVHLVASEYPEELSVAQLAGDVVDRVSGVLHTEGRGHDQLEVRRVEVLRLAG